MAIIAYKHTWWWLDVKIKSLGQWPNVWFDRSQLFQFCRLSQEVNEHLSDEEVIDRLGYVGIDNKLSLIYLNWRTLFTPKLYERVVGGP